MATLRLAATGKIGDGDRQEVFDQLKAIVHQMEALRQTVATYYAQIDGEQFATVEHEVGETMTAIRKSVARMRKALDVLAEEPLPGMVQAGLFGTVEH